MEDLSNIEELKLRTPSVQYVDAGNYTSLVDEKLGESGNSTGFVIFHVFLLFTLICVSINSRIIFVVISSAQPTIRSVKKLVVHFSTICICCSILILFEFIDKSKIWLISTSSTEMCRVFSYFRQVIYGIFPLNGAVFLYECSIGPSTPFGTMEGNKFMAGLWLVSTLVNIPQIFQIEYAIIPNTTIGYCTQVPILDSVVASVAYELIQFLVFHGLSYLFMVICVYKVRFKLKMILKYEKCHRVRLQRRFLRLLFVFLNTMAFVLLCLPTGLITLIIKIQGYLVQETVEPNTDMLAFTTFLQYILLCIAPIMYIVVNPDLPQICPCCILYQGNILAERQRNWRRMALRRDGTGTESCDDIEMAILRVERGEMGMVGDREIVRPVELEGVQVAGIPRPFTLITPVYSMDKLEDYAMVKRVRKNPETTEVCAGKAKKQGGISMVSGVGLGTKQVCKINADIILIK